MYLMFLGFHIHITVTCLHVGVTRLLANAAPWLAGWHCPLLQLQTQLLLLSIHILRLVALLLVLMIDEYLVEHEHEPVKEHEQEY